MEPKALALFIAEALAEKQADDIVILDVEKLVNYASYLIVASGRSERQVSALADHVERKVRADHRLHTLGTEGTREGLWALLDFGDVVVHIFEPHERDHRDLESLWEDAPREPFDADAVGTSPKSQAAAVR